MEDWTCFLSTRSVVAPYVVQLSKKGGGQANSVLEKKIMCILIKFHVADKIRADSSGDQGLLILQWI